MIIHSSFIVLRQFDDSSSGKFPSNMKNKTRPQTFLFFAPNFDPSHRNREKKPSNDKKKLIRAECI